MIIGRGDNCTLRAYSTPVNKCSLAGIWSGRPLSKIRNPPKQIAADTSMISKNRERFFLTMTRVYQIQPEPNKSKEQALRLLPIDSNARLYN
jgi:hypothetical protein